MTWTDKDKIIADEIGKYKRDPHGFVLNAYDWSDPAISFLGGPDEWQIDVLNTIGKQAQENNFDGLNNVPAIQIGISSGHGIGKSALTSWLIDWIMSTRPFCRGTITANTAIQLRSRTWSELTKWTSLCATGHWFEMMPGAMIMRHADPKLGENWFCRFFTCKEENSEGFAGQHAKDSTSFYLFDEASAVPDKIWEVSDGGLTDGEPMRFVFGNPTRNQGKFFECFNGQKHRWVTKKIDSRTCALPNKEKIQEWVDDYGEDSDFVRVRVRGEFPRAGSMQFIPLDIVQAAIGREMSADVFKHAPRVMGVDVARFGDDQSVIYIRQGLMTIDIIKYRELDTITLANQVARAQDKYHVDAIFVDEVGIGAGVVDYLSRIGREPFSVNVGRRAYDEHQYFNLRAECWDKMRKWLESGASILNDSDLIDELVSPEYGFDSRDRIQIERKEDMKKRGLASPDVADALSLTFASDVVMRRQYEYDDDERTNSWSGDDGRSVVGGY